jgi:hypothetical protein
MMTVAWGTTAPVGSLTTPLIVPVLFCAESGVAISATIRAIKKTKLLHRFIDYLHLLYGYPDRNERERNGCEWAQVAPLCMNRRASVSLMHVYTIFRCGISSRQNRKGFA